MSMRGREKDVKRREREDGKQKHLRKRMRDDLIVRVKGKRNK